jgi:WD40 repeat protein
LVLKGMVAPSGLRDDAPKCFAFSPDSALIAVGGADRTVSVWDLATGRQVGKLRRRRIFRENSWAANVLAGVEPPAVRQVGFAGARNLIAQIGDGTVSVWDLATGRERYTLTGRFADGLGGPSAVSVDTGEHGPRAELAHHAALAVAASPTVDVLLVTPARPAGFRFEFRKTETGRLLRASDRGGYLELPAGVMVEAASAVFSPNGVRFAVSTGSTTEHRVEVRRADGENEVAYLPAGWPVAFSPDGNTVAAVVGTGIRAWDAATGGELWRSRDDLAYARNVNFSPSGEILSAETSREDGSQGLVRTWEATTGRELESLVSDERGPIVTMAFSPDGRLLAVARYRSLEVWEAGAARLLYRCSYPSRDWTFVPAYGRCAFSPDGTLISLSTLQGLGIWHIPGRSRQA